MSSTTATWLVTGSSRGLGIEMVIQLLYSPSNVVIATARNPSRATSLIALRAQNKTRLHILQLDVTDQASIQQCASGS
ncbi:hypothetical protein QCA50_011261 [Cerrena zonata]|uniref:Uncharacterized protein n=1 Tax=Cerrena zonata TaxID=2478898 RepID=A0AAW0G5X3_9APHY